MQSPNEIKSRLFSLVNKGIKYDLDRMFKATSLCGDPHKSYKSIHVAGTNGKGSTCACIESILRHAGYKTGLYTSPHITNFEERFKINGVDIDEKTWFDVYKVQEKIINDLGLTFFEAATLMSFEIFKRASVDYAVFETGMGGRLDATNIITPEVSVITKLSLDHQEYLGDDIIAIAGEKLGIAKPGVPLVMLDPGDESIKQLAMEKCAAVNSELIFVGVDGTSLTIEKQWPSAFDADIGGGAPFFLKTSITRWNRQYDLSLIGAHQYQNAMLALTAIQKIGDFDHRTICDGLKSASLPGRFQIINADNRTIVVDVGHNPDAASALVNTLKTRFPDRRVLFVVGMMKDKDTASFINTLTECASSFYFAGPKTDRAADPAALCTSVSDIFIDRCIIKQDVGDALRAAIADANISTDVVCVTGSFYMVSEAFQALGGGPGVHQGICPLGNL